MLLLECLGPWRYMKVDAPAAALVAVPAAGRGLGHAPPEPAAVQPPAAPVRNVRKSEHLAGRGGFRSEQSRAHQSRAHQSRSGQGSVVHTSSSRFVLKRHQGPHKATVQRAQMRHDWHDCRRRQRAYLLLGDHLSLGLSVSLGLSLLLRGQLLRLRCHRVKRGSALVSLAARKTTVAH